MKRYSILALAAFAVFAVAAAPQEAIVLKHDLKQGATEKYKIEMKVAQNINAPTGPMDITSVTSMDAALTYGAPIADGYVQTSTVMTNITTKSDGALAAMMPVPAPPKELKSSGKIDGRNRVVVTEAKAPAGGSNPMSMMMGGGSSAAALAFVEFPDKAVKVGDSWEQIMPKSPATGDAEQKMTITLVGDRDFEGGKVWVLAVKGAIKLNMDASKMIADSKDPNAAMLKGQSMIVKQDIAVTGEALVDKDTGRTLLYTNTSKSKGTVEFGGMNIETDGTVTTKVSYVKG